MRHNLLTHSQVVDRSMIAPNISLARNRTHHLLAKLLYAIHDTEQRHHSGAQVQFTTRMIAAHLRVSLAKARDIAALGVELGIMKRLFQHKYIVRRDNEV